MSTACKYDLKEIMSHFNIQGDYTSACVYGSGHINDTFSVEYQQAGQSVRYILQKLNNHVFKEPEKLMDNIGRICNELHRRLRADGYKDASRRALTTIHVHTGQPYYKEQDGSVWRVYLFIEGAVGYDVVENEEQAFQAAKAFGDFQKLLTELPGERLYETIPGFHDTPRRVKHFLNIVEKDPVGRVKDARAEIEFFLSYKDEAGKLIELHKQGLIPERVTHNDTKLNNVLIDAASHEAVCVIDLDTSMPGFALYDFGDLVRTSTTSSPEDEKNLSRMRFLPGMFKALARGYLSSAAEFLTQTESDNLVFGGKLITYEQGLRFLTDYLEGDSYYKTGYPDHNLIRCRTQMKLVEELERNKNELESYVRDEYKRILAG